MLPPEYFAEYRIAMAKRKYDVREVGFEAALHNLAEWAAEVQSERDRKV